MLINNIDIQGLSDDDVALSRKKNGANRLNYKKENTILDAIKSLAKEPMVILLIITATIYFISGDTGDGAFLAFAIVLVATISLYQDAKSRDALAKLKSFTQANAKVIRNGAVEEIAADDLVIGDSLMIEEGGSIAADGVIIHANDFSVNESILTGESLSVYKDQNKEDKYIYRGTAVASGLAIATVTAVGNQTKLGKIGKSLESIKDEPTPLEIQITNFVKKMVIIGAVVFLIVWAINFYHSHNVLDSLLKALTLAMSILPEEIPVAFTTFMAMGAWRLMKMGIVVKQMKTVETLGSATVICTDKTGTITENKMTLARFYVLATDTTITPGNTLNEDEKELLSLAMWASEPIPFDPMEIALHDTYTANATVDDRPEYTLVHEYPLSGKPPMMTHIHESKAGDRIIAAKGAPEAIMEIADLTDNEKQKIQHAITKMAAEGYRLLAVGEATTKSNIYPDKQQDYKLKFKGIVAFYDPPKKNIAAVLQQLYKAGIAVKIVTGDNAATTGAIARQIGFTGVENSITGEELMALSDSELQQCVGSTNIFTRMFPEAKLRIIKALKAQNEIVAMTGDGVNDGPALKAAHIGIAMGKKGTEIAKHAASLILLEDDLSKMADAVAMGRKIYTNLKKAIQYIISIHIPIILTVFIPLALGWIYPNIFSPVHIIFLELIMGPTCSIIYENEPMEKNTMSLKPRPFATTFFNWSELATSLLQGLLITGGTLTTYQYAIHQGYNEPITRTMVFTALLSANIVLTLINRSFYYSILTTIRYKNNLVWMIIGITIAIAVALIYVPALSTFFKFGYLKPAQAATSIGIGTLSVIWYEVVKWSKRRKKKKEEAFI